MHKIGKHPETGFLAVEFDHNGQQCIEYTALSDTTANRKKVAKLVEKITADQLLGVFNYTQTFPTPATRLKLASNPTAVAVSAACVSAPPSDAMPLFKDFADLWFEEKSIEWRKSYRALIRSDLDRVLIPYFGNMVVGRITKANIISFRAALAKVHARGKNKPLSHRRVNKLLSPLRMVLCEAADRFDFRTPFENIKPLKIIKSDVKPFSLDEVIRILDAVRPDYRDYFTVRFFTGMRTGEIDGLQWKYIDFERRLILVRETIVNGEVEYTKTDSSQREIHMSQIVFDALKEQEKATRHLSDYVFCNRMGKPLAHKNVTNRVWYPLLRHLNLPKRRPYQCRHTAATLWLAAGESPNWIARQLGHANTEMLFKVYARFVPNLTRQDGAAFETLMTQPGTISSVAPANATAANDSNQTTYVKEQS